MRPLSPTYKLSLLRTGRLFTVVSISLLGLTNFCSSMALAQGYGSPGTETLRDPLVPGAKWQPAGAVAPPSFPPPIGSGNVPTPINPGHMGMPPTYEPWAERIPANQIDQPNSQVNLPFRPPDALPPGVPGRMGNPPAPPSTPGPDPGMLSMPSTGAIVTVPAGGRYPDDQAPTTKRPGQTTRDFGLARSMANRRNMSNLSDFGERLEKKDLAVRPRYSEDGRSPVPPRGQAPQITHDLYGTPMLSRTREGLGQPLVPMMTIAPY